jgi:6-phosphofructokinase 1
MKRIAILTSGGDAPGMNAAIRAIVRTAISEGLEVSGVIRGFEGLIDGQLLSLEMSSVSGILNRGGTILKSARSDRFKTKDGQREAVEHLRQYGIDGLITIGGSGTSRGAHDLAAEWDFSVINCPSTIDNDVAGTDFTIGFYTAVTTALDSIDRIRDTATAYDRVFIVEVMGRDAGHLALYSGVAGGAEYILTPEIPYKLEDICASLQRSKARGKSSNIIVLAEGAGEAPDLAAKIHAMIGFETRYLVIGHLQRGGPPNAFDRILASRLGSEAVKLLLSGETDKMVGIEKGELTIHPIPYSWENKKPIDMSMYQLAQILAK